MKTLYLNCNMGAAGDMLAASLLELFPNPDSILEELNNLAIPHVQYSKESSFKCGICGTHLSVLISGETESTDGEHCHHDHTIGHHHNTLHNITHLINQLSLNDSVKKDILAVYTLIAEAESQVHNVPVSQIHFHEVGTLDAIADITAVCLLLHKLAPDKIICSPIHVGSGSVRCAHGVLPVPAPATAAILKGCPIYSDGLQGELCTPTGAALLKHFVTQYGNLPAIKVSSIGYGMGAKDFERANCIQAMFGEIDTLQEVMYELNCNVDDMTAEKIGYSLECFFNDGAVEAFTIPINMKKSRPGTLIRVICSPENKDNLIHSMFKHTTTSGIRCQKIQRAVLERSITMENTNYGIIRRKDYSGYGVARSKYEYEDLAQIARKHHMSIDEVLESK